MEAGLIERVQAAVELSQTGRREDAMQAFDGLRPMLAGDPLARCIFGHYYADLQEDHGEELRWDLYSLEALKEVSDARLRAFNAGLSVRGFHASVYLNIADDYRKLNELEMAGEYADLAEASCADLAEDGYGQMIRRGVRTLKQRLRVPG